MYPETQERVGRDGSSWGSPTRGVESKRGLGDHRHYGPDCDRGDQLFPGLSARVHLLRMLVRTVVTPGTGEPQTVELLDPKPLMQ